MNLYRYTRISQNVRISLGIFDIQRSRLIYKPLDYCCCSFSTKRWVDRVPLQLSRNQQTNKRHNFCVRLLPLHANALLHYDKYSIKSNPINNLPAISNLRFYSKDNNEKSESKTMIQNDPWLKSLLDDIKQDFAATSRSENPPAGDETVNTSPSGKDLPAESHKEYDYRYADENDEIEEFGYYDEHDIGETKSEKVLPISLKRSKNGVFEIEELVILMEHLGAENIISVAVPPEANYCDHMVVVTAKSKRHLKALNEEMLWVHKRKKYRKDPLLHIEGLNKSEWCAMDLGNLVLHIFMNEETRQYYDIENLWLLGPENDPKCQEADEHSFALSPEDLFWLEATGSKEPKTDEKPDG